MAYQQRGRGRRYPPGHDHARQMCYSFGISYPPNPEEAWQRMLLFKDVGEQYLNHGQLQYALDNYTMGLKIAELFPREHGFQEEAVKILCNRSLVLLKLRHYKDAETDATIAIQTRPTFIKGYWRAYQAVKGSRDGTIMALTYVADGLRQTLHGQGTIQDSITFLIELCTIVHNIPNAPMTDSLLETIDVPDISEKEIWTKTLQKLVGNQKWECVCMLVTGERGPDCILSEMCAATDFSGIDITGLFDLSVMDLKQWGILLASVMIKQGASLDNVENKYKKPLLHVAVDLAVKTDSIQILESVLKRNSASINSQNQDGQTALHLAVLSGKVLQPIGERIVGVLLKHSCDSSIRDQQGKRPIDYVMEGTGVFAKLKKAAKSVQELRQDLEALKQKGNEALKGGNNKEALKFYEQALEISNQSQELYKEAAVVYSNRAKVYFSMKDWENALANSLAAVSCDKTYHKGHWWQGKVLCQMGAIHEAFTAYIEGFTYSETASDLKLNFLIEAVTQLKYLKEEKLIACYNQLRFIDIEAWPPTLQKLSANVEWKCVAYLIFGPNLDKKLFKASPTDDILDRLCSGVAGNCSKEYMDLKTVFVYLQSPNFSLEDIYWLDIVLLTIYRHGNKTVIDGLAADRTDTPLHAVARFSLLTTRTNTLEEVLKLPLASLTGQFINGLGDSVYHTITKMYPLPEERTLFRVTECFLNKGFSAMVYDKFGKLPVDYLNKTYNGYVFDLFFRKVVAFSWTDVTHLKERGNQRFKSGDIVDAIELYTQAIDMVHTQPPGQWRAEHSKEIAVLYSNRAEGYLKLSDYHLALEDAKMCVSCDGHWYKGHMRVAKALKGMKKMDASLKAFINAYKDINVTEKVQIEILSELILVCKHFSPDEIGAKLREFPKNQGHMWIKTCYELIRKDDWASAKIAYSQYDKARTSVTKIMFSLSPLCKLDQMRKNPWVVNIISVFLEGGADRMTLTLSKGDTYVHAAVRISLMIVKNESFLDWLLRKYKEAHLRDREGNTPLHTATRERDVVTDIRYKIVMTLLKANIDPTHKNQRGEQAIDLLPKNDTKTSEYLRMAMYRAENLHQIKPSSPSRREPNKRTRETSQVQQPPQMLRKTCEECIQLLESGKQCFKDDQVSDGHAELTEILKKDHKGRKHEEMISQALAAIVEALGDKPVPEIPSCLTAMSKDFYQRVIDGLILKKKWQQLHSVVRKYRSLKGSDKFKDPGFASGLSIVPVIEDPVFRDKEDIQTQIIANMLSSGASMGTDCGQKALESSKTVEHFKVVADLIKKGADTSQFSMKSGDTPIHAIVILVLEKEKKDLGVLEYVFDQFKNDPETYAHLNPCQQNKAGDSLFHLVAKAKFTNFVLKVTEFLCERNVSARYINKDKKLPIQYITKKNDRRLQYLRLAADVAPVGQQKYGVNSAAEDKQEDSSEDEIHKAPRVDEVESLGPSIVEKVHQESERDQRKRRIEELIRLLPDAKHARLDDNICDKDSETGVSERHTKDELKEEMDMPVVIEKQLKQRKDNETKVEQRGKTNQIDKESIEDLIEKSRETDTAAKGKIAKQSEDFKRVIDITDEGEKHKDSLKEHVSTHIAQNISEVGNSGRENETETGTVNNTDIQKNTDIDSTNVMDVMQDETVIYNRKRSASASVSGDSECQDNTDRKVSKNEICNTDHIPFNRGGKDYRDITNTDGESDDHTETNRDDPDKGEEEVEREDSESDDDEEEEDTGDTEEFDAEKFDKLEWEVECTAEVWKTLRDKHVPPELKNRIVKKLQLLASGDWQPVLCKKLRNVPKTLDLFEAKFSKGSRIIWEKAIAFSPRCSRLQLETDRNQPVRGGRIYSEIIRVWDIVFDHDKIYKSVEKIKKSHQRGEECIIQKKLRGQKTDVSQLTLYRGCRIYPKKFAEDDIALEQEEEMQQFFPPASSNETEYHILKFYTFSSTLVSHVMQNIEAKVDFPFKVTDLEHAIINVTSKAPILLLGRSGTGKTTCCLYRLWSKFHGYWTMAREADAPLLPRGCEFVHTEVPDDVKQEEDNADSQDESVDNTDDAVTQSKLAIAAPNDQTTAECDHVHQLFITKNLVLCSEVQKNFRELSHADDLMREHVQHEEDELPGKIQDVGDFSYPLFLTSRQLLMMLDASIGQPYFFDRKDDGSLKADVEGWSDVGPLSVLPLLDEDSESEDEEGTQYHEDEEEDQDPEILQTTSRKKKVDPRREITYQVFVEEVWPKIKKKMSYHPSLVWTEIMSFIKGSFEALSKREGFLSMEDYVNLGRKRAPNFSAEREPIHRCFKRYEHFKKQHHLFDETDLVQNIYRRLGRLGNRPWVIHEVYVDETQDFTQAELCLLIQICQNPNDMFLTGDTAQSIMRGISFRFSDLKSLFYHAKQSMQAMGKTSAIAVPKKVYQLTHNYRSHAGILSLASSVLELMVEFFPESFDRLQRDQGLFTGPQPILLESCSFGDLAVLLRGNKRRTSHIEFGAHQAILVVNEAARDTIPEELRLGLVLTIYEAKGLEFDDVLLYNFFKDSQAVKEWRVVTQYLEEQLLSQKDAEGVGLQESLVEIDEDILKQPSRPRPLTFESNLHKVLNSELKHLYTALTRARVNVWIFDEDMEKRAPMFEYFKARKLVKSLTVSEINEESLAETVFAEKSSKEDWIRRGEDFMRHSLYNVAAKCFGMAGDLEREKLALAHVQALKASRLKDNPREMRREFLKAAEMYLNCGKPAKAAICLQNAKELELSAELFEKLSQYERAGDIYRRLRLSIASSRCYEQLGYFNKAVEVLYENENYDMAIDTLRRYEMRVQDYRQNNAVVPGYLHSNRPAAHHTEEKLSHRAAVKFHRIGNKERMLNAIDSFPKISDRVNFLEKHGFVIEAARILEYNDEHWKATDLLLKHGLVGEATKIARTQQDQALIGHCILVSCRVVMAKGKEDSDFPTIIPRFQQKELLSSMAEGIEMFQACKIKDKFGELRLLQAELSMNVRNVKDAWKAFKDSKPQNEAGLIECADWLMRHSRLDDLDILSPVVEAIGCIFSVCYSLSRPNDTMNLDKVNKCMHLYGLNHYSQNEMEIYPKERPICLTILRPLIGNINADKHSSYILNREDSYTTVMKFLLWRAKQWVSTIWEILINIRNRNRVCDHFQASLECPNQNTEENKCIHIHGPLKIENLRMLIDIDLLMIELEGEIQAGVSRLRRSCPSTVRVLVESFVEEAERDNSEKYKACTNLLDDLMPFSGHPSLIWDDSDELVKHLRKNNKILLHMRDFLKEQWKIKTTGQEKAFKCLAARETEIFVLFEFGYHLFGLDVKCILDPSPVKCLRAFESAIDSEVARGDWSMKGLKNFTLVTFNGKGKILVESIANRFFEAYFFMSFNPNPYEAVFRFSKFVILQRFRVSVSQLPELHHYAMWLEFYLTVGIILVAKLRTKDFPDFVFILPSNYLALLKFIEATFPNPKLAQVIAGIDYYLPPPKSYQKATSNLQDRLKFICFGVSGFGHKLSILQEALTLSQGNPHLYAVVERIIILQMVLVLNIGKAMPVDCEKSLMKVLSNITLPEDSPYRLQHLAEHIRHNVKGISDLALGLMSLLKSRQQGEELLVCTWNAISKQKLQVKKLESEKLFITTFFNNGTLDAMRNKEAIVDDIQDETAVEEDLTEEETEQRIQVKLQQEETERKNRAAIKITKFFKRILAEIKAKQCIAERKRELVYGEFKQFDSVKVTDKYCGYCGEDLEYKMSEALKYQQPWLVGGQSEMNVNTRDQQFDRRDSVGIIPTSPDKGPGAPLGWGNEAKFENFQEGNVQPSFAIQQPYQPFDSHVTYTQNYSNDQSIRDPESGYVYEAYTDQSTVAVMGPQGDQSRNVAWQRSISNDGQKKQELLKKHDHLQGEQHFRKKFEFEIFEKKCRLNIIPKLSTIREFLDNEDYQLRDKEYAEKHYVDRYMEIERLQTNLPKIDSEILKKFQTRDWLSTGKTEELLVQLSGDFDVVRKYVEDVHTKLKEEEEQKELPASNIHSGSYHYDERFIEQEEEHMEKVVEDPGRNRRKPKFFKKYYKNGKRQRRN